MIDNLRRTLAAPAAWLTLLAGWTVPVGSPLVWTVFVLGSVALPAFLPAVASVIPGRRGISKRTHLRAVGRSFAVAGTQTGLGVTFLAHQAWMMSDAIAADARAPLPDPAPDARVDDRRPVPGGTVDRRGRRVSPDARRASCWRARPQRASPWRGRRAGAVAAPFILLWALSPVVARMVSRPLRTDATRSPSPADASILRSTARRTWRFFEAFVGRRKTISCRPTTSRRTRSRSSPTARRRPTSASTCCRPSRPVISAGSASTTPSSGSRRRSRRWAPSSGIGVTSTTGTTPAPFAPSSPATYPPWTAAISPGTCSWSAMPAGRPSIARCWTPRRSRESPTRCGSSRTPRAAWTASGNRRRSA